MAVDAHVSTCGPKVSTCNPRAQTRCVSKYITHTMHIEHTHRCTHQCAQCILCKLSVTHTRRCTLHTLTDTHISVSKLSVTHTLTDAHCTYSQKHTEVQANSLSHTHAQAKLHILTETSKQTPSLLTHKLIRTHKHKKYDGPIV